MSSLADLLRLFGSPKELARAGGFSPWTATRYQRGETVPDALTMIRLMAGSRAFAEAILRLAGLDDLSMDIEQARLLRSLADLQAKRLALHEALVEQAATPLRSAAGSAGRASGRAGAVPRATPRRGGQAS